MGYDGSPPSRSPSTASIRSPSISTSVRWPRAASGSTSTRPMPPAPSSCGSPAPAPARSISRRSATRSLRSASPRSRSESGDAVLEPTTELIRVPDRWHDRARRFAHSPGQLRLHQTPGGSHRPLACRSRTSDGQAIRRRRRRRHSTPTSPSGRRDVSTTTRSPCCSANPYVPTIISPACPPRGVRPPSTAIRRPRGSRRSVRPSAAP